MRPVDRTAQKAAQGAHVTFTQPVRQVVLMLIVLALVGTGVYLIYPSVEGVFLTSPWLNGFIGMVFLIGLAACFWQVMQLVVSVSWIEAFAARRPGTQLDTQLAAAPRLLAPLAALLGTRGERMHISATSARSILDSVSTRIEEARDITRYLVSLLIFLGLLGTFYGLATTVPAVVEIIRSLAPQEGETAVEVFEHLMGGLETQFGGMGTAFSTSLIGLSGSLVVGLLELFASHGQNRFYRELEEWLSTITRLGFASGDGDGESPDQSALVSVLDQMVTQMEAARDRRAEDRAAFAGQMAGIEAALARISDRLSAETGQAVAATEAMSDALSRVTSRIGAEGSSQREVLERIAGGQERLVALVTGRGEAEDGFGSDAESRMRLRSIDVQLLRILEEISAGRQESVSDLRADISALTHAVRLLSRGRGGGAE